jgi:hypothetical protein
LELCKSTVANNSQVPKRIVNNITEQERILKHMRRAANKIQIELAQEDWTAVHRSLSIFYSLNQMVRPEILATYRELSGVPQAAVSSTEFEGREAAVYH